jgi:hypothetical protein
MKHKVIFKWVFTEGWVPLERVEGKVLEVITDSTQYHDVAVIDMLGEKHIYKAIVDGMPAIIPPINESVFLYTLKESFNSSTGMEMELEEFEDFYGKNQPLFSTSQSAKGYQINFMGKTLIEYQE